MVQSIVLKDIVLYIMYGWCPTIYAKPLFKNIYSPPTNLINYGREGHNFQQPKLDTRRTRSSSSNMHDWNDLAFVAYNAIPNVNT